MKTILISLTAAGMLSVANGATTALDFTNVAGSISGTGIVASQLNGLQEGVWKYTWQTSALDGQVKYKTDATLDFQTGAAGNNPGNYAAVKFSLAAEKAAGAISSQIDFSLTWGSAWGAGAPGAMFYATLYGIDSLGNAVQIGDQLSMAISSASGWVSGSSRDFSFTIDEDTLAQYDNFGLIFNQRGSTGGGVGNVLSAPTITTVMIPEPATASLGLAALSLMALRRRRA